MGSWTKQMGFPIIVVDQEQVSFSAESSCFHPGSRWVGFILF